MKRIFGMIILPGNSCTYGETVDTTHINKNIISSIERNDLRYLKAMIDNDMFTEEAFSVVESFIPKELNVSDCSSSENDDQYYDPCDI